MRTIRTLFPAANAHDIVAARAGTRARIRQRLLAEHAGIGGVPFRLDGLPEENPHAGAGQDGNGEKKNNKYHKGCGKAANDHYRARGEAPAEIMEGLGSQSSLAMMNKGFALWFTGLSGSGKTTLSRLIEERLRAAGAQVELLDGDEVRTRLCKGLGFSKEDRDENIQRIGFVSELLARNGVVAITAAISPYRAAREQVRSRIPNFVEVHVDCPLPVLIERDPKGLYKRALAGELKHFTGIDDPYEPPAAAEIVIDTSVETPEASAARIWALLQRLGLVSADGAIPLPESRPFPSAPGPDARRPA